jgi:hypothetical protein
MHGEKRRRGEAENWKQELKAGYRIPQTEYLLQEERMLKTKKR